MRKLAVSFIAGLALLALTSAPAAAASITLNFAGPSYAGANGAAAFGTVDQGITVSLAAPNLLQTLEWVSGDGIGIDGVIGDDGEIGTFGLELLVSALGPPPLTVTSFEVAQLFSNEAGGPEQGQYSLDGGATWNVFTGNSSTGFLTVNLVAGPGNNNNIVNISFRSTQAGNVGQILVSDYSLRSITVAPVPEPASMLLLGSGLVGGIGALRRRKANAKK